MGWASHLCKTLAEVRDVGAIHDLACLGTNNLTYLRVGHMAVAAHCALNRGIRLEIVEAGLYPLEREREGERGRER